MSTLSLSSLLNAGLGLVPVLVFLALLRYMDSYKLVSWRRLLSVIGAGAMVAAVCLAVNGALIEQMALPARLYSLYLAPLVEESAKALVVVLLFRAHRIGFLVDAAILGFAVGTGFALVENLYHLQSGPSQPGVVWLVRGFGTALMHGGVTAIFALLAQLLTERSLRIRLRYFLPGLLLAATLHSAFNHFFFSPVLHALLTATALPALLVLVFRKSARAMREWLRMDFDADVVLIEEIKSGQFSESRIGAYLSDLQYRFEGMQVVDMLCYLRVYTELALRAKGALLMREQGIPVPRSADVDALFRELQSLERSIGKIGVLAMSPFLQHSRKDIWQLSQLSDR